MQVDGRGGVLVAARFAGDAKQKSAALKLVGTLSVDPPNQAAAGSFNVDVALPEAKVGDVIILQPPETLEDTLTFIGAAVQAAGNVRIRLRASAAVDGAARTWGFALFGKTD